LLIGSALLEKLALLEKPQQEEDASTTEPKLEVVDTPEETMSTTD
jgi:hypothetical protein